LDTAHRMYVQLHSAGPVVAAAQTSHRPAVLSNWPSFAGSSTPGRHDAARGRGRAPARGGRFNAVAPTQGTTYVPYGGRGQGGRRGGRGGRHGTQGRGGGRAVPRPPPYDPMQYQPWQPYQPPSQWHPPMWNVPMPSPPGLPPPPGVRPNLAPGAMGEKTQRVLAAMVSTHPLGMALPQDDRIPQPQAASLVGEGACMLCLQHGHASSACTLAKTDTGKSFMAAFKRTRKRLPAS
jgi:hypothetical protein